MTVYVKSFLVLFVLLALLLYLPPGRRLQKYIRFFTGLILMLLLLTPFLSLTGSGEIFQELYHGYEQEQYKRELQEQEAYFQDLDLLDFLPEEYALTESGGILPQAQGQEENGFSTEEGDGNPDGIGVGEIKIEEVRIGEEVE